jgi:prolipoprotein diacylglyceryl transferase
VTLAAFIPSPSQGVWHLGPIPIRAYALCILTGILVAVWFGERRWVQRGGREGVVADVAVWAVPFGVIGARIYHVISSPAAYFGSDGDPVRAGNTGRGGWGGGGAIALGAVGAWIGCRRHGVRLGSFADAVAPAIPIAQAIGRLGNWFNQELFGRPTTLPWALEIDPAHRPSGYTQFATFHPMFAYEALWNLGVAAVLVVLDRRRRLGHGRVFWAYVALYTIGRLWIEAMRIDDAELVLGLRVNIWTSLLVCCLGVAMYLLIGRRNPQRETSVYTAESTAGESPDADQEDAAGSDQFQGPVASESTRSSGSPSGTDRGRDLSG